MARNRDNETLSNMGKKQSLLSLSFKSKIDVFLGSKRDMFIASLLKVCKLAAHVVWGKASVRPAEKQKMKREKRKAGEMKKLGCEKCADGFKTLSEPSKSSCEHEAFRWNES